MLEHMAEFGHIYLNIWTNDVVDHIVRRASNVFKPPHFTGVESLGFAPTQRSENERFRTKNFYRNPSHVKKVNSKRENRLKIIIDGLDRVSRNTFMRNLQNATKQKCQKGRL